MSSSQVLLLSHLITMYWENENQTKSLSYEIIYIILFVYSCLMYIYTDYGVSNDSHY